MVNRSFQNCNWPDSVNLNLQNIPADVQQNELTKIKQAIHSPKPYMAFTELRDSGLLVRYFPEFEASWGPLGEQHKFFHPEGNVWIHTLLVMEQAAAYDSPAVRYAATFHDIAKPLCFFIRPDGNISNHGHDIVGANLFEQILGPRLQLERDLIERVGFLIRYHMLVKKIDSAEKVHAETNSLMLKHPGIYELADLSQADAYGTTTSQKIKAEKCKRDFILNTLKV